MFTISKALKAFLVKSGWATGNEDDNALKAICVAKLGSGELNAKTLKSLTAAQTPPARRQAPPARRPALGKAAAVAARPPVRTMMVKGRDGVVRRVPIKARPAQAPVRQATINQTGLNAAIQKGVETSLARAGFGSPKSAVPSPTAMLNKAHQIRVKGAIESYDMSRKGATYPQRAGMHGTGSINPLFNQPAMCDGQALDHPSQADKAVAGAYFKWCLQSQLPQSETPRWAKMTDHDRDLILWAQHNLAWNGFIGKEKTAVKRAKLSGLQIKTLLDDSTSGAIEATPIVFDNAVVLLPVLYGELFPFVNVVNVARGRRMKGALINQPTITSGTAEGTAITPLDTTSFISAFDTNIWPAVGAIELGLDLEEDSPVDLGGQIIEYYGLKSMEYLDRVIAYGNGTNEPQGIFMTTGAVVVGSDNSAGGPLTVSDFEGLIFGLAKKFRNEPGAMPCFLSNDVMYRRGRAIPVGPADERRVFGMNHGAYELLDHPYKVQADIPNGKIAFANLRRYRMYRRLGLQVRVETQGATLARSNTKLIVVRMRFGGQMETGGAVAVMTDAQV